MLPILFTIGPIKIYTFGVFLVLALFWGSYLLWKLIRLTPFKEEDIFDSLFWVLAGGLFLGRLIYILFNLKDFGFNLLKFILINGYPGISLYGATVGGLLALYLFCRNKKIKFSELIDYYIAPFMLALTLGKLGSFFSESEIGYESFFFAIGVVITYKILFQIRKGKLTHGFNLHFFLWYFGLVYLTFDKMKVNQLYFLSYSFNRVVSTTLFLTFSFYFLYYFRSTLIAYGKKTFQKIREGAKRKVGGGQEKNPTTDN